MRLLVTAAVLFAACNQPAMADDKVQTQTPVPVLVELFTSEGCSSCPPADDVLARLEKQQPVAGALVVPLAHHVDYWDSLGWPDPFSSPRATARQKSYRAGSYTPQAVIDGGAEMVGSRGSAIESAVAEAAKRPHVKVAIAATGPDVTVSAAAGEGTEIWIALVQTHARIAVPRGENAGRTLEHTAIVRDMKQGPKATFTLPKDVATTDLRWVAFVQDTKSRRVLGSTSAPVK